MLRIVLFILLSLSVVRTALGGMPPRSDPPSPILPGQYRNIIPKKADNKDDPQAYISPPSDKHSKKPHPALILDAPPGGLVKAQVITNGLRGAPGAPIQSIDQKTNLHGFLSYKKPLEFENHKVGAKYEPVKGQGPARDMSPSTLEKMRKKLLPAAAVSAFQQGSSKGGPSPGASTSNQLGHAQRPIKPLPKPKSSTSSWAPVGAAAPKPPPSGAFTFSMPKPKGMQGNPPPRVNLDSKEKAPAAGSKRKSTSPPANSKRRNRSPGAGSKRSPSPGSKRRSPSPGAGAKKPRLSRRDYLGHYYRLL